MFQNVRMRMVGAALAAVMAVTSYTPHANAAPLPAAGTTAATKSVDNGIIDVRRRYRGRHWGGGAAAAGIALGIIGGIAAANAYRPRGYYCDPYWDHCGPRRYYRSYYYAPRPYYYGPRRYYRSYYYGPRRHYYYGPRFYRRHYGYW